MQSFHPPASIAELSSGSDQDGGATAAAAANDVNKQWTQEELAMLLLVWVDAVNKAFAATGPLETLHDFNACVQAVRDACALTSTLTPKVKVSAWFTIGSVVREKWLERILIGSAFMNILAPNAEISIKVFQSMQPLVQHHHEG